MNKYPGQLELFLDVSSELLCRGHRVRFRAYGRSMQPTIREGEAITVEPVEPARLIWGDIILYRSDRGVMAHCIVGLKRRAGEDTIFRVRGDASGSSDESVESKRVLGKVVSVERHGYRLTPNSRGANMWRTAHRCVSRLKRWIVRPQLCFLILAELLLALGRPAPAAEVTIDAAVSGSAATHNGGTPTVVFISDQTGYAFYRDYR